MFMSCLPALRLSLSVTAVLILTACAAPDHRSVASPASGQDAPEPPRLTLANEPGPDSSQPIPTIRASHEYGLPELFDLAQRLNPITLIAWGEAQQAAEAAFMVQIAYLLLSTANVVRVYKRSYRDVTVHIL